MVADPSEGTRIEAAGGVVWRPAIGGSGVEVALVHRPKYDDWSLPKGKLVRGEHVLLGALREIAEETGMHGVPGPPLGWISYLKDGQPKRVRYWSVRARSGQFAPNAEVDQLMWLPPREAEVHLCPDRDRRIVSAFAADSRSTRVVLLVRHATAGDRHTWPGEDRDRPLDEHGRGQAEQLADLLAAYDVTATGSADVLRCLDTIGPYAARRRLPISSEPLLSETGADQNTDAALDRLLDLIRRPGSSAVCTQRGALDALLQSTLKRLGHADAPALRVSKAGMVALHMGAEDRLTAYEVLDAPSG